jgi:hypothetical protein
VTQKRLGLLLSSLTGMKISSELLLIISNGGIIAIGTTDTLISSGRQNTFMIWPLMDGFVAHATIGRVWSAK